MLGRRSEDYLEMVYELSKEKGYTRIKDIADELNVKPASASEMMQKLSELGYIVYKKGPSSPLRTAEKKLLKVSGSGDPSL